MLHDFGNPALLLKECHFQCYVRLKFQVSRGECNIDYVHFPAMHHLITNFFVAPSATFIIGSIIVFFVLSFLIVFHNNRLFSYPNACFCNCIFIMILVPGCMLAYNLHHDSSSSHVLLRFSALLWRFPHKELRRKLRVSQNMISHVINFLILASIFTIDSHLQSQAGR